MLEQYLKHGRGVTPIRRGEKRPLLDKWTTRPITALDRARQYPNCEWGWVLGPDDLVIDIDPRNGGAKSLKWLSQQWQQETGKRMLECFPVVRTPGGGVHLYCKIPKGMKIKKNALPGIDLITQGGQVLIAGSRHPNGGEYYFDATSPFDNDAPVIPNWMCDLFAPGEVKPKPPTQQSSLTLSQIEGLLNQLDVTQYANNASWLQILQACHEASGGEALDLFLDWSLSDPAYADQRDTIISRWNSHKPGKTNNITAGTLINAVISSGGYLPNPSAEEETAALPDLPPDTPATVGDIVTDGRSKQRLPVSHLEGMIDSIKTGKLLSKHNGVLIEISKFAGADRNRLLAKMAKKTGFRLSDLRDAMASLMIKDEENDTRDFAMEISTIALKDHFQKSDTLIHAADQMFWLYSGTHWEPIQRNIIDNYLLQASLKWQRLNPDRNTASAVLISSTYRVLAARVARSVNLYDASHSGPTIINVTNGELHLDTETGTCDLRPHDPTHWQTTVLPIPYSPKADCPAFKKYLSEVFIEEPEAMASYTAELLGYTIQKTKDIAAWILLTGEGSNGKSTLLKVLTALLGTTALCSAVKEVERDNHGMHRLPGKLALIDDDLEKGYLLPDGFLKKVSENKILTARPLHREAFDFENSAICWMSANELPRAKDISHGMMRRANVLHFGRIFSGDEVDRGLAQRIINTELSGVLNFALAGLRRLRKRGYFDPPEPAKRITNKWKTSASAISMWISAKVVKKGNSKILFGDAYTQFKLWAMDQGLDRQMSKIYFRRALESVGIDIRNGGGNKLTIYGIELKKIEEDGD